MNHTKFQHLLMNHFNKSELRSLCFDLGINYENLPGTTLEDKARELILYSQRHDVIELLRNKCIKLRPLISWPNVQSKTDSLNRPGNKSSYQAQPSASKTEQSIYGNYNAISGQGGSSTVNVKNVYEYASPRPQEYLENGIKLLQAHSYQQATDLLNSAIQANPTNSKNHFYLAIALLNGVRPKLVSLSIIRKIEQHLKTATNLDPKFGPAYILWAIVKYDHYVMNGMFDRKPTTTELLNKQWIISKTQTQELLSYIEAPKNQVWEWLRSL